MNVLQEAAIYNVLSFFFITGPSLKLNKLHEKCMLVKQTKGKDNEKQNVSNVDD